MAVPVPADLRRDIAASAAHEGLSPALYAGQLLDAAQLARCRDERALGGRTVAGALLLAGSGLDHSAIAATLGVEPAIVSRIIDAWRGRLGEAA